MATLTHEEAIEKLVDLDVARWGEQEREASRRLRARLSHALALNAIAHYDVDRIDHTLAAEARGLMTPADERVLRQGG